MNAPTRETAKAELRRLIDALFADVGALLAREGVASASLRCVESMLAALAARADLFPESRFPPSAEPDGIALYQLGLAGAGESLALYLNVLRPGKQSRPHDHTTWAAIAAVQGRELNRVYRRRDDGSDPQRAELELAREIVVRPGTTISFLPDDIHSIHGQEGESIRHLHLYGRPLDRLTERKGYDLETGEVVNYNRSYMTPAIVCAD